MHASQINPEVVSHAVARRRGVHVFDQIEDGNATFKDAERNATLSAIAHSFCDVASTEHVLRLLAAALRTSAPAAA